MSLPGQDQFDTALLLTLREEVQFVKTQMTEHGLRLTQVEETLQELVKDIKKLVVLRTGEIQAEHPAEPAKSSPPGLDPNATDEFELEGVDSHWNYLVASKGGYNNILHLDIQALFRLSEDPIRFLEFLVQKREHEMKQRLQQLQAEYQKLQGSQLQEHFQELWKSHYMLLKKKQTRTWKEEVFLEAFDAFITWIQQ